MSDIAARHFCRLGWATLAAALFFGLFVWPTPYEFQILRTTVNSRPREILYRVNRITGSYEKVEESVNAYGNAAG